MNVIHRCLSVCSIVFLVVALCAVTASARAQETAEAESKAACGRKAKDAGFKGKDQISSFVADCVANMRSEEKTKEAKPEKGEKAEKDKEDKKGKKTKKDKKK